MPPYLFLVLLKPEGNVPEVDRQGLLRLMYDHFERQEVEVLAQAVWIGPLLRGHQALNYIYPRLSVVSETGERALTRSERDILAREAPDALSISADEACIEFGRSSSELRAEGDNARVIKLGPGAYAAYFVDRSCFVLNHFFPEFRDRFYADDASVIALECQTTRTGLHRMRETLVGDIQPSRAEAGSLRASALAHAVDLGLGEVSIARNFFHISPGYIEAMYQLAFLFPERGSFQDKLLCIGAALNLKPLEAGASRVRLAQFFAKSEQMPLYGALEMWSDGWKDVGHDYPGS